MNILVFGAAFDPPHNGHMVMCREAIKLGLAERIILVPCGNHPFDKKMSPALHRLNMTAILVDELRATVGEYFELSDIEVKRGGVSFTYETLDELAKLHPDDKIGWLMGSDQLPNFDKWHKYNEILAKYPVYVYPRKGYPSTSNYPQMTEVFNAPVVDISSSSVRESYLKGEEIDSLVNPEVKKYIQENMLWKK